MKDSFGLMVNQMDMGDILMGHLYMLVSGRMESHMELGHMLLSSMQITKCKKTNVP